MYGFSRQSPPPLEPPYHYFTGATLLHHVAGNPDRGRLEGKLPPLPKNSPDIARLLLDAGADVNARTPGPNGGDTMGLLVTSYQASDADVTGPLMDVLLEYGATVDLQRDDCLDSSLANHAPRAAEKMIALGAKPDLFAAAALGRMDLLRGFFDSEGRLLSRPRRHGKEMSDRDAIGLTMLYAYVREQRDAVDFLLEKDGNWDMIGVNNGAALHRAAFVGDLEMVKRLVAKGADLSNRDNPFGATPLSWADHNKQTEVFQWMPTHCAIDLHDAVSFAGFRHVGRCEQLEGLWCMYCRDTTDAATEHIAGLSKLKTYYAGQTKITDRSLEMLSRMPSLEKLEFWNCAGITNAGAAFLASLPRLREINLDGCRQVTPEVATMFPAHVRVRYSV